MHAGKDTAHFQFKSSEEARTTMTDFIKERFLDLLGDDMSLLEQPEGLEILRERVNSRLSQSWNEEVLIEEKKVA